MAGKVFDDWARNPAGWVSLSSLDTWATGVTEHGDIALFVEGYFPSSSGREASGGQYLLSKSEAMNIAQTLVRAVALADVQVSAPQATLKLVKETPIMARVNSPTHVVSRPTPDFGRPAATIFF
jgi:hypothetical protein